MAEQKHYLEVFENYGISNENAEQLMNVLLKYKSSGSAKGLYEELPEDAKRTVDGISTNAIDNKGNRMTKRQATKFLLDNFINDADFNEAVDEYQREITNTMNETNTAMSRIVAEELDSMFDKIEEYRTEDPELADKLEHIRAVFDDCKTFKRQYQYINSGYIKKFKKRLMRWDSECFYFNKKVNKTDVKIPDITNLGDIINVHLNGEYPAEVIGIFLMTLIESCVHLEMDLTNENYINVWYCYKLIEQLYSLQFKVSTDFMNTKNYIDLIDNLRKVLDKIKSSI